MPQGVKNPRFKPSFEGTDRHPGLQKEAQHDERIAMTGFAQLIDPFAASIVVGGSILATCARCGLGSARDAASQIVRLPLRRFRYNKERAALAPLVSDIAKNGLIRAQITKTTDRAISEGIEAMLRRRSFTAFLAHQQSHRELRLTKRFRASESLDSAGELAPILGLTGTLIALSQLDPENLSSPDAMVSAISVAILSTLYGLLLAHFICHPLARAIERRGKHEEENRAALIEWLASNIPESEQRAEPAPPQTPLISNWAADLDPASATRDAA